MKGTLSTQWGLSLLSPQRHHFAQAIAILNTHGCNIFDHFSRKVMGLCGGVLGGSWGLAQQRELTQLGVDGMSAARTMTAPPLTLPRTISACWT